MVCGGRVVSGLDDAGINREQWLAGKHFRNEMAARRGRAKDEFATDIEVLATTGAIVLLSTSMSGNPPKEPASGLLYKP